MSVVSFQNDVIRIVKQYIDKDTFSYIFSGNISIEDFITQILFEKYKDSYLESSDKNSLRSYVSKGSSFDTEYQLKKRTLTYSNFYKEQLQKDLIEDGFDISDLPGLEVSKKINMEEKLSGHSISNLQNIQLEIMNKIDLLKSIISKRIVSSKKVSNTRFVEMFEELDKFYCEIKEAASEETYIDNLINIYDIERLYSTELIYQIATFIDEHKIKEYDIDNFCILFAIRIKEVNCICSNRFINKRYTFIDDICKNRVTSLNQLLNILYLKLLLFSNNREELHASLQGLCKQDIDKHLMENYNLFNLHNSEKKWNNNKIRIARMFYDRFFKNVESPKIRT
ncbi:hypothetical protein [Brevibacillus borstelensis]|uniref:hypothetical protein n=1 Tax=Brevibacillus borstelensis TaxID=45462 RepID=UPI002E1C1BBF|nr:hypothetical protein [Brevibacillus borstelensis]